MRFKLVLELVINESLPHEFADDNLYFGLLFKESIILADLNFIVLYELEQLALVIVFIHDGPVCVNKPSAFALFLLLT